jgi:hypothetical protein
MLKVAESWSAFWFTNCRKFPALETGDAAEPESFSKDALIFGCHLDIFQNPACGQSDPFFDACVVVRSRYVFTEREEIKL